MCAMIVYVVFTDSDQNFCRLFVPDEPTRRYFSIVPEMIFYATYILLELQFPAYLVVEDYHGGSEIIGLAVMVYEDYESMR